MLKNRVRIIAIGSVVITILIIFSAIKMVDSNSVDSNLNLGMKYLQEGNYDEAILAFEKVIAIDKKNEEVKQTIEMLNIYEKMDNLYASSDYDKFLEELEKIKDYPKYEIIKEDMETKKEIIEEIEDIKKDELARNGMGNSIVNILLGGNVAYGGKYAYYANPADDSKLYKMNIDTGEREKLSDDSVCKISVYKDYVYYVRAPREQLVDNEIKTGCFYGEKDLEVCRIKNNDSESEVILDVNQNLFRTIQIVDNILYFDANYSYDPQLPYSDSVDIIALDLNTLEMRNITRRQYWIINKRNENLELYSYDRYGADVESLDEADYIAGSGGWNVKIVGINEQEFYYETLHMGDYVDGAGDDDGIVAVDLKSDKATPFTFRSSNGTFGKNKFYFTDASHTLYSIDLITKEEKAIKTLDMREMEWNLYEVRGYLAYFNNNNELVIDKEIRINE